MARQRDEASRGGSPTSCSQADTELLTHLPTVVSVAAVLVIAVGAFRFGVDWLSLGPLPTGAYELRCELVPGMRGTLDVV